MTVDVVVKRIGSATLSLLNSFTTAASDVLVNISLALEQQSFRSSADARWAGPMPYCPVCRHPQAWAVVQIDQDTLEIEAYGLEVKCFGCGAVYSLACPGDTVRLEMPEPPLDERGL